MMKIEWADFKTIVDVAHKIGNQKNKFLRTVACAAFNSIHEQSEITLEFCLTALGQDTIPNGDRFHHFTNEHGIWIMWDDEAVKEIDKIINSLVIN